MTKEDSPYRLSALRPEFADRNVEQAFREFVAPEMARDLRMALWVWAAILVFFGGIDYLAYGPEQATHLGLLARVATLLGIVALIRRSYRSPEVATSGLAVSALEVAGYIAYFMVFFLRPDLLVYSLGVIMVMIIALFVFIPNQLYPATLVAAFAVLGTLVVMGLLGASAEELFGVFLLLVVPAFLGFFAGIRLQRMQRQQFALLRQAEVANRQLNEEIEQRKLLQHELQHQAITDPLTGLYNRRHFESLYERERQRARRDGTPLSLCLVDLDYFKRVNDEYGHEVGDRVLQFVAALLESGLRQSDIIGRLGGEEFVLLLPNTDLEEARELLERLRQTLHEQSATGIKESLEVRATFSAAPASPSEDSMSRVLKKADDALYHGKNQGRDCVVTSEVIPVTGVSDSPE